MSAVAEISKPSSTVTFAAKRADLRLTKVPRYPIYGPGGREIGREPGQALGFKDGVLPVTADGAQLAEGGVLPRDEALEFLRGHRLFGDQQEGFWEIHQAPPAVSVEEMQAVARATAHHDVEGLAALREAEVAGWGREDFLGSIDEAVGTIEAVQAEVRAQIEAEQQAAGAAAKPAAKRSAR